MPCLENGCTNQIQAGVRVCNTAISGCIDQAMFIKANLAFDVLKPGWMSLPSEHCTWRYMHSIMTEHILLNHCSVLTPNGEALEQCSFWTCLHGCWFEGKTYLLSNFLHQLNWKPIKRILRRIEGLYRSTCGYVYSLDSSNIQLGRTWHNCCWLFRCQLLLLASVPTSKNWNVLICRANLWQLSRSVNYSNFQRLWYLKKLYFF